SHFSTKRYNATKTNVNQTMQRECMFRKLTAIEIAEGALLADIGIIFQLLAIYIPIGKGIFHVLTPIVFAIIVLRRGFYVGTMSLVVALFVISIFRGPGAFFLMLLECGAGRSEERRVGKECRWRGVAVQCKRVLL